ncbi:glycine zipper 2TM domain-containing protein [Brevundimonas sp.]|jgi:hypothetical protein|uniref:glycine zipper 2TM domain-containing protein n=1 Tax=Brevundimonas sp. TaxID=1871086 RepID=UPI002EDA6822
MKTLSKIAIASPALVGAMTLLAAAPAQAQSRDRDDTGRNAVIGAVVGGLAGAALGNGDGTYVIGGALAGAALGAAAGNNDRDDCGYYRGGRCYRNQGHWEREHGINSRDPRWEQRQDYRDYRRDRRDDRRDRDYRYDRRW